MRPYRQADTVCALPPKGSLSFIDAENVNLSAAFFKGDVFYIRIWESAGRRTAGCLTLPKPAVRAHAQDFVGNPDASATIAAEAGTIRFDIRPYEIMTLRVELA